MFKRKSLPIAICAFACVIFSTAFAQQPPASPPDTIRVSESALRNAAASRVEPPYPPIAKAAGASGTVVVEIVVGHQGQVDSAKVISGHPLLRDAAYQAARQWKFRPTELSGKSVKVIGTLSFAFDPNQAANSASSNSHREKHEDKETLSSDPIEVAKREAAQALHFLALAYTRTKQFEEAVNPLKQAIELKPDYVEAYNDLGWAYTELQLLDEAIETYLKLIAIKPDYLLAHHNLGWAYFSRGYYGDAIDSYQRLLQLSPEYPKAANIHSEIALCYAALNNIPEALKAFDQSLKLSPNNSMVLNNFGYFLADRGEKLDLALELLHKSLKMDGKNEHTLDSVGWAYFKLGDLEQAERYLKEAERQNSRSPSIHEHLGDLLQKRGQTESARNAWQKALSLAAQSNQQERLRSKLGLR